MSETVTVDSKGRILLPKRLRRAARIALPGRAVATIVGEGRIQLIVVDRDMEKAKQIARKKLARWREEAHEADRLALEMAQKENR